VSRWGFRMPRTSTHAAQSGFLRSVEQYPDEVCLRWDGGTLTYAQMADRAMRIANAVGDASPVAILAGRGPTAYAGVLGTLMAGAAYVPLNTAYPAGRNRVILERSGAAAVIADGEGLAQLPAILTETVPETLIVADDPVTPPVPIDVRHPVVRPRDSRAAFDPPATVDRDAPAYLMFTSGSTGVPKGVAVSHANVRALVSRLSARYRLTSADRLSQMFDLTFDLSVFDQFMTWEAGACLVCPSRADLLNPAGFIREHGLTVWFSVPSAAMFMRRLGALAPGSFPSLRWSLFCGEPLPAELAEAWSAAAPGSTLENLYGPTEVTVACTVYRWRGDASRLQCVHGIVPIGEPFPGLDVMLANASLQEVPAGERGELVVSGDQVTLGYWNDHERTRAAFVVPPGRSATYYRTGDVVVRPTADAPLCYLGRMDHQVKILGHRVELLEIEAALREATGRDSVAVVAWPRTESGAGGVVAFLGGGRVDAAGLRATLASRLPPYMVPRQVHELPELPLTPNGKIDRRALELLLEGREPR
jgi:amino acid adenylation domain-containing protein